MKKEKLLYFYTNPSTFVRKDIEFLSLNFRVISHEFHPRYKAYTPFLLLKQFFLLLWRLPAAKVIVCQFSAYHSLLPSFMAKLTGKPCLIIPGGSDCVSFPSINYGNFRKKLLGWFTRTSYHLATHIAPVHENMIDHDYTYSSDDFPRQGIRYFCPGLKTPISTIHNGYDAKKWFRNTEKVTNRFITVIASLRPCTLRLKGLDLILEIAARFPHCEFYIIGMDPAFGKGYPTNVKRLPFVKNELLIHHFSAAQFYLQLSMSEGFPNALCEAMLCECVPVVSNVGGSAFIVNDSGYVLEHRSADELSALIEKALIADKKALGEKARKRIAENFTEEKRCRELNSLVMAVAQISPAKGT